MPELQLPARYEPLSELGKGGGGEVWVVRDRHTGARLALKVLAEEASEREMAALVREAVALSGLEGLGVPRVVRFGRLPGSGRPFMLRELVDGESLHELIKRGDQGAFDALARAAEQLTVLHRAGLLHGDVKPANIIVAPDGHATLVDLGLAAPWRDSGAPAEGLTPRYAAPELFEGGPLTVRAEVYALGVALDEAVRAVKKKLEARLRRELGAVVTRATAEDPSARFPSADEFASALRRAAQLPGQRESDADHAPWPVVGIERTSSQLLAAVDALGPGAALAIEGPPGSGRTTLLRRVAWSLGIEGDRLLWIDESLARDPAAVQAELAAENRGEGLMVLVDDADALERDSVEKLEELREAGASIVSVGGERLGDEPRRFEVPPLERHAAADLVRRAIPSLTDHLLERVLDTSRCRPGELRRLVRRLASGAVASDEDFEHVVAEDEAAPSSLPADPLERALFFLDRGRFTDARSALDAVANADGSLLLAVAHARLDLGLGESPAALERLERVRPLLEQEPDSEAALLWALYFARAHVGTGEYARALELIEPLLGKPGAFGAEALAYQGLALSFLGRHQEACAVLERAVEQARGSARVEAVALTTLGLALQRAGHIEQARSAYERGIAAAERAGEAGLLGTLQLNLAGLKKMSGDIAGAIEHLEAAVDMGRRSGRRSTVRHALLNLANTDLYLGRLSRARESIDVLEAQRSQLPPVMRAQLAGLTAELSGRLGHIDQAAREYEACAAAYDSLGRSVDSAEARLEGVVVAARALGPDLIALRRQLERARGDLGSTPAHRPLLALATALVAALAGDEALARSRLEEALSAARETKEREWVWRALAARAELEEAGGQPLLARRDREEALATLEGIGARLPRDLREVYWNDPRRRQLRASVQMSLGNAATDQMPFDVRPPSDRLSAGQHAPTLASPGSPSISSMTSTPLEQRLARILEVNAELAGELDLGRLTARVTDHAVELLRAERGFVLLREDDGSLTVHTSRSRAGDDPHAEFSRSIAEDVIAKGEPIVTLSARDDARMKSYASVHQLMLQSVACVPIMAPSGAPIGALYVETRVRPGQHFQRELPTLRAFADQVAIAIESARLIGENRRRADELEVANAELYEAQEHLRELLGDRTAKLKRARKRLRDARDTLLGHFGYQGLVGTSEAMRRVYALMDRVKDTDVPVLITGESGTGKEVVARAIHNASGRAKARFLGVNCGAIPEHLLESELFGHVKGAFTGADRDRKGLFREGEGGTVLLDEIGEMPHKMQAGMLRVLQDRRVRPVGGTQEEPVDVRLLFATNRDLAELVEHGEFREDLYYRIHVVELRLPPLRERPEDIPQLVGHFLGIFAARYKREKKQLTRDAMRRLAAYDWPGNVRQLEHVLLNAWVLSDRPELEAADLDLPDGLAPVSQASTEPSPSRVRAEPSGSRTVQRRKGTLSQHRRDERERILEALRACNWNRVKAAELSGIPRRTFYRRLREYGIQ